jgi:magnesium transporter
MAITILRRTDGRMERAAIEDLPRLLESGAQVWIDADGSDPALQDLLTSVLKLHPLAAEDILSDRPSPKVEDYGDYLYVVAHGIVRGGEDADALGIVEVDLVWTKQWLFTHHEGPCHILEAVTADLERNHRPFERGPAFLAHAILDHLIDYYLPVVDAIDDDVDEVERRVVADPSREVLGRIFKLKRSLQHLRRIAVHQREVLHRLSRGEFDLVPEAALPFYRDVFDHFVRVADLADGYRDTLSGALDAYLSVTSNRMNEVMKALTLVATVMLPMTFIVGVYGMNFEHMPELKWKFGYLFVWILLILVPVGMVTWFRRKGWL